MLKLIVKRIADFGWVVALVAVIISFRPLPIWANAIIIPVLAVSIVATTLSIAGRLKGR